MISLLYKKNLKMNKFSGKLLELLDDVTGIFIVEKEDNISTRNLIIDKGVYLILDDLGDKRNCYIEILYYNNVVLLTYIPKICRII